MWQKGRISVPFNAKLPHMLRLKKGCTITRNKIAIWLSEIRLNQ